MFIWELNSKRKLLTNQHHPSSPAWIISQPPTWSPYLQSHLLQMLNSFWKDEIWSWRPTLNDWFSSHFNMPALASESLGRMLLLLDCSFKSPLHTWLTCPTRVSVDLTSSRGLPATSQGRVGSPCNCSQVPCGSAQTIITHSSFWSFHRNASSCMLAWHT